MKQGIMVEEPTFVTDFLQAVYDGIFDSKFTFLADVRFYLSEFISAGAVSLVKGNCYRVVSYKASHKTVTISDLLCSPSES
jgi:hypothetical protein